MQKSIFISLLLTLFFYTSTATTSVDLIEFQSFPKNQIFLKPISKSQIIFETNTEYILKSSLANFDENNYYYVQLSESKNNINQWLPENVETILFNKNNYAIVKTNDEDLLLKLANKAHEAGHYCGRIQKLSPKPLALVKNDPPHRVIAKQQNVGDAVAKVQQDNIIDNIKRMQGWKTRHESHSEGQFTGEKLKDIYQGLIPADRSDVEIDLIEHRGSPQKSIRVRIVGQSKPDEIVILGSHIDSINSSNNSNAPGADDNASGTSTNIEVFRTLMEVGYKPQSTIEIHGYAAEEIGLVGSAEMADDYKSRNVNVISMVQFDMNGFAKSAPKISFVTNSTNSRLTGQLEDLVEYYLEVGHTSGYLLFGSSDHASWNRRGYPVAFPTEDPFGYNRKIHTKDDTFSNMNSTKQIYEFAKLGVAYLMHFAQ